MIPITLSAGAHLQARHLPWSFVREFSKCRKELLTQLRTVRRNLTAGRLSTEGPAVPPGRVRTGVDAPGLVHRAIRSAPGPTRQSRSWTGTVAARAAALAQGSVPTPRGP